MVRSPGGLGTRYGTGIRLFMIALVSLLFPGCEMLARSLADESDPEHVGARAYTLRDFDAHGNPIPPSKK